MSEPTSEQAHAGRSRGSALTVQGWQNLVLAVMGTVVLAGGVIGFVLLKKADAVSRELSETIQPSRVSAYQVQAALRDQETAVRGYVISADEQFLDPYVDGQRAEDEAAQDIRTRLESRPELIADLDAVQSAADRWRTNYAEPLIASVAPGKPIVLSAEVADEGKTDFDELRRLFDEQNDDLTQTRASRLADLDQMRLLRDVVLSAVLLAFIVAAVVLAVLTRSAVTRPLDRLAQSCRRITEGNFDERITPRGPKDIRAIATDVENMRQRIVAELESSRAARTQLVEQAGALDAQALELKRSNAELEQFAYVASHDLQEPLRKVASFCQLIEKRYGDKLDERGVEYIGFAVDGAKRMQILINDLLAFSRVGRLNATHAEIDLNSTVDAAMDNLSSAIEESGAEVVRPAVDLPRIVGDSTLLTQLWQNLIGNAVKFQRAGRPPRIVIDWSDGVGDRRGDYLISVSDNGIGIADEFVDKVFVLFQRLHGRDSYGGTGIGLALCKKIVEYHGGTVWIDTSYTDGTRFQFTLPRISAATDESPVTALEGKSE